MTQDNDNDKRFANRNIESIRNYDLFVAGLKGRTKIVFFIVGIIRSDGFQMQPMHDAVYDRRE